MFCLLTSMKYQINRGHVMFCLLTLMKIIPNLTLYLRFERYHKQIWAKHGTRLHGLSMETCYFDMWRYHFRTEGHLIYFIGVYIIKIDLLFQSRNVTLLNVEKHSDFTQNLSTSSLRGPKVYSLKYFSKPDSLLKSTNWILAPLNVWDEN